MDFSDVLNPADLIAMWPGTPREAIRLYDLMLAVEHRERSDWPTHYGEVTHIEHMTGRPDKGTPHAFRKSEDA